MGIDAGEIKPARHACRCHCVGYARLPESLTFVSSSGFTRLPPCYNANHFGIKKMSKRSAPAEHGGFDTAQIELPVQTGEGDKADNGEQKPR